MVRRGSNQESIAFGVDQAPKVLYECHPGPQARFALSEAQEVFYGGALGGGKSYALRAWGVRYCMTYPRAQIVLFRRTYRELEDTHIRLIQQEIPKSIAHYSGSSHDLIFKNGSVFQFRFIDREEGVRTYDSVEYDAILFDEITMFTEYMYTYLLSRCRSTKPWWPGRRIRSGGTPLGLGMSWVKSRFVTEHPINEVWTAPEDEGGLTREFIPARAIDNPTLMESDPDYVNMLKALPYEEYRAKALGDWDVSTDLFFTRFRKEHHICEPFDIPDDWDKFMCVDYGFNAPYCVLWFARPPNTQSVWFYREHYAKQVKLIDQIYRAYESMRDAGDKIKAIILDPSMFHKTNVKGDRISPMSDDWRRVFGSETLITAGDNDRVPGWSLMREMVDWQDGPDHQLLVPPRLHIFNTCTNLEREMREAIHDNKRIEDVDTDGDDHAIDAARYGLRHAFQSRRGQGGARRYYFADGGIQVRTN